MLHAETEALATGQWTIALATSQCGEDTGEVSPPVGGGGLGKFSYFRCKMVHSEAIFFFFWGICFTLEGIKVLGEQILEKILALQFALSDDSVAIWTAALRERNADR